MKDEHKKTAALISSSVFIISLAILVSIFMNPSITGFAALNDEGVITISNKTVTLKDDIEDITRQEAVEAINLAEENIQEINLSGFSTDYVNDLLIEANKALNRADYAEVLKGEDSDNELLKEAKAALAGLDWKGFRYREVLIYTTEIELIKLSIFEISDNIIASEIKLEDYKERGVDTITAEELLTQTKQAFEDEQYEDARELWEKTNNELEAKRAELTTVKAISKASKNFVQRNWWWIIILCAIFGVLGWYIYKRYIIYDAKKKLKHFRIENKTITELMKKAQRERFESGTLPASTYKIRMDKYRDKLLEIKRNIPVFRAIAKGKRIKNKFKQ
jgi:hypothetical protein